MSTDNPEEYDLNKLLTALGLSPAGINTLFFFRGESAELPMDEKRERILDRSQRWIRFLDARAARMTSAASRLYEELAAPASPVHASLSDDEEDGPADVIDRLEWTLSALESWIEEQQPQEDSGRFRIRWTDNDGLVFWGDEHDGRRLTSLRAVARNGAEVEGAFAPDVAGHIADLIVRDLRSGELHLMRTRPIASESSTDETVFELIARGEDYLASIAMADDNAPVAMEVEAKLHESPAVARLASLVDAASYGAAKAAAADASVERVDVDAEVSERIDRIAEACDLRRHEALRCLLFVATNQLDEAVEANDQPATYRLARAVRDLSAFVLSER